MPKLKVSDDELDIDELEDAEYTEGDYESYDGEQPPKGTILAGYVKKMWWTYTRNEDPMLKILFVADGNAGELAEYDGLPIWENAPLMASTKFRWKPFIDCFGITLKDIKGKLVVAADDDNMGAPIEKIGTWEPGEDARCRVVTGRERYNGEWNTKVGKWLEADEEAEEDEDEEPAPPPRRARAAKAEAAAPKRPARGRKAAEPEPEDEEDEPEEDDEDEAEPEPPKRATASRRRTAAKPAAKPARTRSTRSRAAAEEDDEDEPPF